MFKKILNGLALGANAYVICKERAKQKTGKWTENKMKKNGTWGGAQSERNR